MPEYITNAPDVYDGFSTVTLAWIGAAVPGYRRVQIDDIDVPWQVTRYQSGLQAIYSPEQWEHAKVLLRLKGEIP